MNCPRCGSTLFQGQCLSCEMVRIMGKAKPATDANRPDLLARPPATPTLYSPTNREIPPPDQTTAEVVAWLTERCPHRVSPYGGNVEMEMPRDGRAFVELIGQAIEHGRSLGPRIEESAAETGRARFDMLEIED